MKRLRSILLATLAVMIATVYAVPAPSVSAESSALSIAPKKNYVIEPGDSVDDTVLIRNLDRSSNLDLTLRVVDFSFTDDTGTPKLFLDPNTEPTTWSLRSFMTLPESVSIGPGESKSVKLQVSVPENQGAGSFYSAIVYSTGAPNGGNVALSASGVTLVFVTIPGEVNEKLTLEKFGVYNEAVPPKTAGYDGFISVDMPKKLAFTLKNEGNVTESPVGSITLRHMFGQTINIDNLNPTGSLALIGQTRTFTTCIKTKAQEVDFNGEKTQATQCAPAGLWPGMYTANLDIYYGQNGNKTQEITKTIIFFYLPWWFIITFLIVLAIAAYFVWRFVTFVRRKLYGPKFKTSSRRRR